MLLCNCIWTIIHIRVVKWGLKICGLSRDPRGPREILKGHQQHDNNLNPLEAIHADRLLMDIDASLHCRLTEI